MRPYPPLALAGLLLATCLAPSAHAYVNSYWSGTDTCDGNGLGSAVTMTYCSIEASIWLIADTPTTACSKTGSTYHGCFPYLSCDGAPFSTSVPARFSYSCTGFPSQSCDVLQPGTFSGCDEGAFGATYQDWVGAGSCRTFEVFVSLVPLVPTLDSASLSHSIVFCVSSTLGPYVA